MIKSPSVFILIATLNCESSKEYASTFVSDPSRRVNFLPVVKSLHPGHLTKSEPTFKFISLDTTPPAVVIAFCLHNSWLLHLDLTADPINF